MYTVWRASISAYLFVGVCEMVVMFVSLIKCL